jgi:hypothetical protein
VLSTNSTKQPSLERPLLPTARPVERLLLRTRNLSARRRLGNLGIGGNLCSPVAPHAVFEILRTSLCHRCSARSVIHRSSAEPTNLPQLTIISLRIPDATQWESDGNHRTRAHCKVLPPCIAQGWPSQLFSQAHPLVCRKHRLLRLFIVSSSQTVLLSDTEMQIVLRKLSNSSA